MKTFLQRLILLLVLPLAATAAEMEMKLDPAPDRSNDPGALQNGARVFVQYCLKCHPASFMRYNRLLDIGFTEQQVRDEFLYPGDKIGDTMTIAMDPEDAERWFSVTPRDHSVSARARTSSLGPGEDWIYTYLRSFYRDPSRPSGWNNLIFPNVAMHNVLWEFQGEQSLGDNGKLTLSKPGKLGPEQFDEMAGDLVGFLKYMSEPSARQRRQVGIYVLLALGGLLFLAIVTRPSGKQSRRQNK